MWLYLIAVVLILLGIVGGILTGGIFTIVLLPLGIVVLVAAVVTGGLGQIIRRHRENQPPPDAPLPHAGPPAGQGAGVPSSPEALADARRAEQ